MKTLEIHVKEEIKVFDVLNGQDFKGVMLYIERVIQKFMDSEQETITIDIIKKSPTRAPPTLGISVSDGTKVGEALS